MTERVFTVAVAAIFAFVAGVSWWSGRQDPVVAVDRALTDLPAVTLDGRELDRAFFGDEPWLVSVWLPG